MVLVKKDMVLHRVSVFLAQLMSSPITTATVRLAPLTAPLVKLPLLTAHLVSTLLMFSIMGSALPAVPVIPLTQTISACVSHPYFRMSIRL